jgi:hypothetical protein
MIGILSQSIDAPDAEVDVKQYRNFGSGRRWFSSKPGRRTRTGSMTFLPTTPEMFLYALCGRGDGTQSSNFEGYSVTGPVSTVYTHTFRQANVAKLASFNLDIEFLGNPNFQRIFTGGQIDTVNLTLNETGELEMGVDYKFINVNNYSSTSPTLITQPLSDAYGTVYSPNENPPTGAILAAPYMFYDRAANISFASTFNYSGASANAGGTNNISSFYNGYPSQRALARVKSFNLTFSNNLKDLYFTQSSSAQNPFDYVVSYPDFSLHIDLVPSSQTASVGNDAIYDLLASEAAFDVLIPFTRPNGDSLNLVFNQCRVKSAPHNVPDDGGEVTVPVELSVNEFRIIATDKVPNYGAL